MRPLPYSARSSFTSFGLKNPHSNLALTHLQMYYDDLPLWGFIGKVEKILWPGQPAEMRYYLFTHVHFDISYNNDRVIEINVSTDPLRTGTRPTLGPISPTETKMPLTVVSPLSLREGVHYLTTPPCVLLQQWTSQRATPSR
jgi:hypothetical protein